VADKHITDLARAVGGKRRGGAGGKRGVPPVLRAGNAAIANALQRQAAGKDTGPDVTSLRMRRPERQDDVGDLSIAADSTAAMAVVLAWFDREAALVRQREGGSFIQSVAELVYIAGSLRFKRKDGTQACVREIIPANELELGLRTRARVQGVQLLEHRALSDAAGLKAEVTAILQNLGKVPTEITLGGDSARITASIFGKVSATAKVGEGSVEGEATPSSATATIKGPGGSAAVGVRGRMVRAEIKAGDLVSVTGEMVREADGGASWRAELAIGTLGGVITAEDVAAVLKGAQDTFEQSALELVRGIDDPATIKAHGGPLASAVGDAVEKARKSAAQAKPGWSAGLRAGSSDVGGLSASVTLTWVF
jgi:hypothetical protein